jgi:hypothetical protein
MSHLIRSWNGRAIRIREDRYVCLTDMAQATSKRFNHWYENSSSKSYLSVLSHKTGIPVSDLVDIRKGGNPESQGTWGHPKVALRFAQWCSDDFAVQVDEWIDELLTTGSVSIAPAHKRPYFYDRLQDFQNKTGRIKPGYFCIFQEIIPLISELERYGYCLPEDAIIDSSIGKRFCSHLRNECGIEPDEVCETYKHWYPGRRWAVDANLYPLELIQVFREWLEYRYYHEYLIPYFKGRKDPEALQAVSKFLGLLESA